MRGVRPSTGRRSSAAVPGAGASSCRPTPSSASASGSSDREPARRRPSRPAKPPPDGPPPSSSRRCRRRGAPPRRRVLDARPRRRPRSVLGHDSADAVDAAALVSRSSASTRWPRVELRNRLARPPGCGCRPRWSSTTRPRPRLAEHAGCARGDGSSAPSRRAGRGGRSASGATSRSRSSGSAAAIPAGCAPPEDLWELVATGSDAIGAFPDRPRLGPGRALRPRPRRGRARATTRHGGFLHDAAEFDAAFFGISPREALAMDPQQRLLLETAWEALSTPASTRERCAAAATGVFAGVMHPGLRPDAARAARRARGLSACTGSADAASSSGPRRLRARARGPGA